MKGKIHVFDWKTFSRKFSNYLALGLAGLTIWYGSGEISNWRENRRLEEEVQIRKDEGVQRLEQAINDWNTDAAFSVITDLRSHEIYIPSEISEMEEKAHMITEDGLYDRIQSSPINERATLAEKYLSIYPSGEHKNGVISELLVSRSSILSDNLQETAEFDQTYQLLIRLTSDLRKYSGDGISLPSLPLERLVEQGKKYLKDYLELTGENSKGLNIGNTVQVVDHLKKFDWNSKYYAERTKTIPWGSVGKIIDIDNRHYVIKFEDTKETYWSLNWGCIRDFLDKGWNVAFYKLEEINALPSINEVKKSQFQAELDDIMRFQGRQ